MAGKILPAGQVRQRLPISQADDLLLLRRLNVRGSTCTAMATTEMVRPARAAIRPASSTR